MLTSTSSPRLRARPARSSTRRLNAQVIERRRAKVSHECAEGRDLTLELGDGLRDRLEQRLWAGTTELRREPEPERGEVLQCLIVQLAGPPRAFLLGGREPLPASLGLDGHCGRDRCGSAGSKRLEQALVLSAERRASLESVDGDQHPVPPAAEDQRDDQTAARVDAEAAEPVALEPRLVGVLLQAKRPRGTKGRARQTVLQVHALTDQPLRKLTGARGDDHRAVLLVLDDERTSRHERPAALGDQTQDRIEIGLATERPRDLHRRVERVDGPPQLGVLGLETGVAPRVVDGHTGELGQQPDRLLVLLGELPAALLLGQVQIPERNAAHQNGDPEKRPHRRVSRGKAVRVRVGVDIGQPQSHRVRDQLPEHPASPGKLADPLPGVLVETDGDEPLELGPSVVGHAERRVPRSGQLARGLEHSPEHDIQIQISEQSPGEIQHPE